MKPLGYVIYLKNHRKRVASTIITIAICIVLIGGLDVLTKNILRTQERDFIKFNYFTLISPQEGSINKDALEAIKGSAGVDRLIRVGSFETNINTIGSQAEFQCFAAGESDIKYLMGKMKLGLVEGKLQGDDGGSIVINENLARALKLKLGDYIDPKRDSVTGITEKYRISGILKGDNVTAFIPLGREKIEESPQFKEKYMVVFKEGSMKDVNTFLTGLSQGDIKIQGLDEKVRFVNDIFKNYNSLINLMVILTIGFLSVVLGNHSYVHYIHRRREFGILKAIGFTKNNLILKVGSEITITTFAAMLLGILLLVIMNLALNRFYMLNIGLAPLSIKFDLILKLIPIPLSISIFTFIPVSRMIDKIDAITIIERVG